MALEKIEKILRVYGFGERAGAKKPFVFAERHGGANPTRMYKGGRGRSKAKKTFDTDKTESFLLRKAS